MADDEGAFLPIATTRPETILGDTAVAVHPEDERYKHFVGRECIVPCSGRRIRIIADEYVDPQFGTGALKITPGKWLRPLKLVASQTVLLPFARARYLRAS